jgi:hypothetical protein
LLLLLVDRGPGAGVLGVVVHGQLYLLIYRHRRASSHRFQSSAPLWIAVGEPIKENHQPPVSAPAANRMRLLSATPNPTMELSDYHQRGLDDC